MTEIGFYHLRTMPLDRALPRIVERALAEGHRVVVIAGSAERVDHLDALLWTYDEASFLPHGSARDGNAESQPVWLTTADENPNRATMLVLLDGQSSERLGDYARCCDIFDGNDGAAVAAARLRWKEAKAAGHQLAYWEQTEGKWEKRGAVPAEGG
ncbi:MAG TPA: DNA polymerase III subunit chi [Stellaceae bacterium]|nr:DNA polymerase III subunit chi [Stellaceae bacterium]